MPYSNESISGEFDHSFETSIDKFYGQNAQSNKVTFEDNYYYNSFLYEPSPLERLSCEGYPGEIWAFGNDHNTKYQYLSNSVDDNILLFSIESSSNENENIIVSILNSREYRITIINDENGNNIVEYKNKEGNKVLKQLNLGEEKINTYYVYDDFDNLVFVIPPEAVKQIIQNEYNWGLINDHEFRNRWMFQYTYDNRQRLVEKRIPGANPIHLVYDKWDRLVLTQDGNQWSELFTGVSGSLDVDEYEGVSYKLTNNNSKVRLKKGFYFSRDKEGKRFSVTNGIVPLERESEWFFIKYDNLSRPIITGICELQGTIEEIRENASNSNILGEEREDNIGQGYTTNLCYPFLNDSDFDVLVVNYYDDYQFVGKAYFGYRNYEYINTGPDFEVSPNLSVKSKITGIKTRIFGTQDFIYVANYYNDKYQLIQSYISNITDGNAGFDRTSISYDFIGNQTKSLRFHKGREDATIFETREYDHADRLESIRHKVNGEEEIIICKYDYNERGQLIAKKFHSEDNGLSFLQKYDIAYNIRGWLEKVNNGIQFDDVEDAFGFELEYGTSENTFNGNIASINWRHFNNTGGKYQFYYDDLMRINAADFSSTGNIVSAQHDVNNIVYDHNGNIQSLDRFDMSGSKIDELIYAYNGNRLILVDDNTTSEHGFRDDNSNGSGIQEYFYDLNGNMVKDINKGILNIEYNFLNLPDLISLEDNNYVRNTYNASGIRVKKESNLGHKIEYVDGIHYLDETLDFVQTEEGRYNFISKEYIYDIKDYAGNIRSSISQYGDVVQTDDFYPFGMTFNSFRSGSDNRYLFHNGTEWDPESGWYHFKYRMHDPTINRFFVIDPIAEDFVQNSPYAFAENKLGLGIELEGKELLPFPWLGSSLVFSRPTPIVRPVVETVVRTQTGKPRWNPSQSVSENINRITKTGRQAHAERQSKWESEGFNTEQSLGKGNRADGVKIERGADGVKRGIIRELKPNNRTGRSAGRKQLERYVESASKKFPDVKEWQPELELYYSQTIMMNESDATIFETNRELTPEEIEQNKQNIIQQEKQAQQQAQEAQQRKKEQEALEKCANDPNCS